MRGGSARRRFLFLQGNTSSYFAKLGEALSARGYPVHRVNFNGGDMLFWSLPGAINYGGSLSAWPSFFTNILDRLRVTDIVLFGDCRPIHRQAIKIAQGRPVNLHILEEGYLRPNWITLEQSGTNGFSSLPRDPEEIRRIAERLPDYAGGATYPDKFARRAVEDVLYHLARVAMFWRFPRYRFHAPVDPFVEYFGWIFRTVIRPYARMKSRRALRRLPPNAPFFLLPMQLDSDYQVREHSHFTRIPPALKEVIGSFAKHATADSWLVIKSHPLDCGLTNWRHVVRDFAAAAGVEDRVVYLDHDDLAGLVRDSQGLVTINSTVGALALQLGRPVIALGTAIYDIAGLTFQHGLDRFWREATLPDPELLAAFHRVLIRRCLVRGSFFNKAGVASAVAGAVDRFETEDARPQLEISVGIEPLASLG